MVAGGFAGTHHNPYGSKVFGWYPARASGTAPAVTRQLRIGPPVLVPWSIATSDSWLADSEASENPDSPS